eukprot:3571296-Prymnesium_polylepis.1
MSFGEGHGKTSATTPAGCYCARRPTARSTRALSSEKCRPRMWLLGGGLPPRRAWPRLARR